MPSFAEAVAAWTLHYEADTSSARTQLLTMHEHRIPEGHRAELLGASLALTPPANRCVHWGDKTTCVQCLTDSDQSPRRARVE